MPCSAHSPAATLVIMITAALGAQYVMRPGFGEKPRIDEMFTIEPDRCGSIDPPGRAHAVEDPALHHGDRVVPVLVGDVLRVRADATDAGVVDDDVEPAEVAHDRRERLVDLRALRNVGRIGSSLDAVCASSSAATRAESASISSTATDAPASASSWAMPRPRPVPDPVTIATRPSSTAI